MSKAPVHTEDVVLGSIEQLRATMGTITQEDREQLASWERLIKTHRMRRSWLDHPITKEVFDKLADQVAVCNVRLSTEEELTDADRRAIFRGKEAFMYLLVLFSDAKDDTGLALLDEEVRRRTGEFQEYNRLEPPSYHQQNDES